MKKFAKTRFFSNFAPFFMETTVNTSNFEQFYRTLFPRLVQLPWLIRRTKRMP